MLCKRCVVVVCAVLVTLGGLVPALYGELQRPTRYRLLEGTTLSGGPEGLPPTRLTGGFCLVPDYEGPCDMYRVTDFHAMSRDFIELIGGGEY